MKVIVSAVTLCHSNDSSSARADGSLFAPVSWVILLIDSYRNAILRDASRSAGWSVGPASLAEPATVPGCRRRRIAWA